MGKILVAGAGHGGLTAAINLAENGYDVTVIEKKSRAELGHDWHDCLNMSAFDMSGIARPDKTMFSSGHPLSFRNPSATVLIETPDKKTSVYMDRKDLIAYLVKCAEQAGVKLVFGHKILSPIVHGTTVTGLNISDGENEYKLSADLIIDAAGMYSPVRTKLPCVCNIQREMEEKDTFHVFRAYYKNKTGETAKPSYIIELFHMNRPGLDWIITHNDYVDILVGKFSSAGKLTQEEVDEALTSFRSEYPYMDEKAFRGGTFADIPITRMLPVIICDGYAAVGDSAGMTVPMSGSGIVLSMKAGKILADTVINGNGRFDKKALWKYEYEYFKTLGSELLIVDILKNFFTHITSEQVDFLLEKEVLSSDALSLIEKKNPAVTSEYLRRVASYSRPLYKLIMPKLRDFKGLPLLPIVNKTIPKEYDEGKVRSWVKLYCSV